MNPYDMAIGVSVALSVSLFLWSMRGLVRTVPVVERPFQDPLPFGLRVIWPLVVVATHALAPRLSAGRMEAAHRQLQVAGQDFLLEPEYLLGLRTVATGLAVTLFAIAALLLGKSVGSMAGFALALGAPVGWFYPDLWLGERRQRRQRLILKDLPVFLDFIVMAVEAGLNLTGGIEQATLKGPKGPLAQEFSRLLRDIRSGVPRAEALVRLSERTDMPQVSSFTGALIQADRVGASLGTTLRAQAMQRREERFLRAEKLALEAPVKMMLPLVMFFFPQVFLVLAFFIYSRMLDYGVL